MAVTIECSGCSADERAEMRRILEEDFGDAEGLLEVRLSRTGAIISVDYAMAQPNHADGRAPQAADATSRVVDALRAAGKQVTT